MCISTANYTHIGREWHPAILRRPPEYKSRSAAEGSCSDFDFDIRTSFDEKRSREAREKGKRYRLVFDNQTDDAHPIHLHRNSLELINVHGKPTAGILKDVVLVKGFRKI